MMTPAQKQTIRQMVRDSICRQNSKALFTCNDCAFWTKPKDQLPSCLYRDMHPDAPQQTMVIGRRMASQMPECFSIEPLRAPLAEVWDTMQDMGYRWYNHDTGWVTIVSRLFQRADRFGFFPHIKKQNLERYGS